MTRKNNGQLPRLDTPPSHDKLREGAPPDLRGARYTKLTNSAGSSSSNDEPHPLPYYPGDEETLAAVTEMPWVIKNRQKLQQMHKEWKSNPGIAEDVTSELVQEVVDQELKTLANRTLEDMEKSNEIEGVLKELMEEDLLPVALEEEMYAVVWLLLYEEARSLSAQDLKTMAVKVGKKTMKENDLEMLADHILEGNEVLPELHVKNNSLASTSWDVLVYNYSVRLQQQSMACNAALNMLQEEVATRAGLAEMLTVGVLASAEEDLDALDEFEKMANPPRRG